MRKRAAALVGVTLLTAVTCVFAFRTGVNPPLGNVAGAFASILAGVIVARLFRVPDHMYYLILAFVYFASPVGSVLNFYRRFGPYDKIVHFFSGIMIAAVAYLMICGLFRRNGVDGCQREKLAGVTAFFCIFAAGAGAGIWEIMEFSMDILLSGEMQRGMADTITDMIAGNLGGLCYGAVLYAGLRRKNKDKHDKC